MSLVVQTEAELRVALAARPGPVAFVPTMGALHDGHLSLVRFARTHSSTVVLSVFVNPLQFAPGEDFDRYPRTLEADLLECERAGVDVVFAPAVSEIYPAGDTAASVHAGAGAAAERFEGKARPGHFDGMLTVVNRLFELVQPDVAVFGEKDAQQLFLVQRMVADRGLPIQILPGPIVREADGLALSSRNRFLSPADRAAAVAIPRALDAANAAAAAAATPAEALDAAQSELAGLNVDYLALVDPDSFEPLGPNAHRARLLVAVRFGETRLLDNALLHFARSLGGR